MKGVTVLIVCLTLMLCAATAQASSEPFLSSNAITANQTDQPHNVPERKSPFPTPNPDSDFASDRVIAASEPLTVLDYAISPQVTIDLECRPFAPEEKGLEFLSEGLDVGQITQNFMLGFRYTF